MNTLDWNVHSFFVENRTDLLTSILVPFTKVTGPSAMAVIAISVSLILYCRASSDTRSQWLAFLPAVSVLLANGLSFILKRLISRGRPLLEDQLLYHYNPSMPSGHAVGAFALATAIALTFRRAWTIILFCMALIVSISRLYVGVHWLTDIAVGAVLGCLVALSTWWVLHHKARSF